MTPRLLGLAAFLTATAALLLPATPALAASQTFKLTVAGPGTVYDNYGYVNCSETGGACEAEIEEGTPLTLYAYSTERSTFSGWEGCETASGTECTLTIGAVPVEVKAEFEPIPQQTLTVQNPGTGPGGGTVNTYPGFEFTPIECGNGATTCEAQYNEGSTITLYASPNEHSIFAGWSGACSGTEPTCEVSMTEAESVEAEFDPVPQQTLTVITTEGTGAGTVTGSSPGPESPPIECGATCEASYNEGTTLILFATPAEGSAFLAWTGCTNVLGPTECEVTLSAAASVEAEFGALPEATLKPVSGLTAAAATLNAHLDPAGGPQITACRFEYIDFDDYAENARISQEQGRLDPWTGEGLPGTKPASRVACQAAPPYQSATDVEAQAAALSSGGGYHVRILATNAYGTVEAAGEFTTLARYRFSTDFGSAGSGDGQLESPQDVALDNSAGDLYVADTGNHRVDEFGPAGEFILSFGREVNASTDGDVCRAGESCQAGVPGSEPGQFESPTFVAVDNSGGPSAGDLYVADSADDLVQKFDPEGNLITSWEDGGQLIAEPATGTGDLTAGSHQITGLNTQTGAFSVGQEISAAGIPPDTTVTALGAGSITISNAADASGHRSLTTPSLLAGIAVRSDGRLVLVTGIGSGSGIALDQFGTVHPGPVAIDPATNYLYTDTGSEIERSTSPSDCNSAGADDCPATEFFGAGHLASAAGLAFDPATEAIYAANAGADDIAVFTPYALPRLTTGPVESPALTSATLTGVVEPAAAEEVTGCFFQYGETAAYGQTAECEPASIPPGANATVKAQLTGLNPFATYHYRLVATDAGSQGLLRYGHDRTLVSDPGLLPSIDATSSSALAPTEVTLGAEINPDYAPTVYRFEYGTTAAYGSQTVPSESIGQDATDHSVSSALTGLAPATTYHFRAIAVNLNGTAEGPDQTFTTPAPPAVAQTATSAVGRTSATLGALIQPGYRSTTYHFEIGTGTADSHSTPQSAPIGSDNAAHQATATVSGLQPDTTYHFRVFATNEIGTTEGPDQTFTTAPEAEKKLAPPPCTKNAVRKGAGCACKHGYVRKHGKCLKKKTKPHHKREHNRRGGKK